MMAKNVTYFSKSLHNDDQKNTKFCFFLSKSQYYGDQENLYFRFRS